MTSWHRYEPEKRCLTLCVYVQPNAASTAVAGLHGDALKLRIAAPAVDDKANRALVAWLSDVLRVRASRISIRHGVRGRRKIVEIADTDRTVLERLGTLMRR